MFLPNIRTFQEFRMREAVPLATIQQAVLEWLQDREDVVLFGAQAVNAYVAEPRMTQDIDLLALHAAAFAEELQRALHARFHLAIRIREVGDGRGYRLFQVQAEGTRHLVDIRAVTALPDTQRIARVLVVAPADLIAQKVLAYAQRRGQPKSGTDWRDIAMLLLTFPDLKCEQGAVSECLRAAGGSTQVLAIWQEFVRQDVRLADETDEF